MSRVPGLTPTLSFLQVQRQVKDLLKNVDLSKYVL